MLGVALLSACGNKVSLENYNRIKVGQSYDEVRQMVGDPAHCDETLGIRSCQWGDSNRSIRVNFAVDKVVLMSAENLK
jgi:hypothetical protein